MGVITKGREYDRIKDDMPEHDEKNSLSSAFMNHFILRQRISEYLSTANFDLSYDFFQGSKKMSSYTDNLAQISEVLGEYVDKGVKVKDISEVKKYLLEFPELLEAIDVALNKSLELVKDLQNVVLNIYEDPEEEIRCLAIDIYYDRYDDKIIDELNNITKEYLPLTEQSKGWIIITPMILTKSRLPGE